MNSYWWCPACNNGPSKNHRKCVTRDFHFNAVAWEKACVRAGAERARRHLIEFSAASEFWLKKSNAYILLPPGSYFIGDVNKSLTPPLNGLLKDGSYVNGNQVYVAGHAYYSRVHPGSNGLPYEIESGYIGVMSVNICNNSCIGSFHTFKEPVEVSINDHILHVKSYGIDIKIDTRIGETCG